MATKYISPTGNDTTGDGSTGLPWKTLTKANASSSASDTIILKAGTYTWNGIGDFDKSRTYQGVSVDTVILDGADGDFQTKLGGDGETTVLDNITFENVLRPSLTPVFQWNTGVTGSLTVTNCRFNALSAYSADQSGQNRGSIFGNTIGFMTLNQVSFTACEFNDLYRPGATNMSYLFSATWTTRTTDITMTSCIFYFERSGTSIPTGVFFTLQSVLANVVITVKNSIFYANNGSTVHVFSNTANATITSSNNCFQGMTNIPTGSNHVLADPLFYDTGSSNFNLRPTSPCLTAGTLV